jgi:hypothetical protein
MKKKRFSMKFTEEKLEKSFAELLRAEGFPQHFGISITCNPGEAWYYFEFFVATDSSL